jgi:hypothetical protein
VPRPGVFRHGFTGLQPGRGSGAVVLSKQLFWIGVVSGRSGFAQLEIIF